MNTNKKQVYKFEYLPNYAAYLLKYHIDDYTREQIRLSYEIELPLLKHFKHLSSEEIFLFAKSGAMEFLTNISINNVGEHIENAMHRWITNQIPSIDKLAVEAEDITLLNHIRGRVLKKCLFTYNADIDNILKLNAEIDDLILAYNTTSTNAYITILKESIEDSSRFSENIINASPGVTFVYDLVEQKEVYINGKLEQVFGQKAEEIKIVSNFFTHLACTEDLPLVEDFLKKIADEKEGKTRQVEYRFKNKQGKYKWLRCYASVYRRDAAGKPLQIIGVAFEISNEKETAGALLKREKELLEAQAIGQIGSYEWDIVSDKSVSTPQLKKIFEADRRQTLEEILAKVHPDDKEKLKNAVDIAFKTGVYKCEYRYLTKKGEKVIDSRGIVAFDELGQPLTLSGTVQDITERKRIEEQLLLKTLELERSNVQLGEFAYVASHDLKEPLRKIAIFSNLIMSTEWDVLSERGKVNFQKITGSVKRMQQLIEGVLSYSSLSGQTGKEKCNLQGVLNEVLDNLEFKIKERNALVRYDQLPVINAIPFQMEQLFQNLIANALKFVSKNAKPQIDIKCTFVSADILPVKSREPGKKAVRIDFIDNGIGFDQSGAEKIFGLFQRLHGKTEYEGSGLGLAICKKIVENHSGIIMATSQPNSGATFTIILPV